jgi:hypothetical protein
MGLVELAARNVIAGCAPHYGGERCLIPIRRPDFEAVLRNAAVLLSIGDEIFYARSLKEAAAVSQAQSHSVQEKLDGGEPLLTIDNGAKLNRS